MPSKVAVVVDVEKAAHSCRLTTKGQHRKESSQKPVVVVEYIQGGRGGPRMPAGHSLLRNMGTCLASFIPCCTHKSCSFCARLEKLCVTATSYHHQSRMPSKVAVVVDVEKAAHSCRLTTKGQHRKESSQKPVVVVEYIQLWKRAKA